MKFYVLHHDGPDYFIATEPDYYGSCERHNDFHSAKAECIAKIKDDINELKSTLSQIRRLKEKDFLNKKESK